MLTLTAQEVNKKLTGSWKTNQRVIRPISYMAKTGRGKTHTHPQLLVTRENNELNYKVIPSKKHKGLTTTDQETAIRRFNKIGHKHYGKR